MASDYLLEIEGIKGESRAEGSSGGIDIQSFSWGVSNSGSVRGGGVGSGKASFQDLHFVTKTATQSPQLMLACCSGKHFVKATLSVRQSGQKMHWIKLTMSDVLVSSYQIGGTDSDSDDDGVPVDQVSLSFPKITMDVSTQGADGPFGAPVSASWDLAALKK